MEKLLLGYGWTPYFVEGSETGSQAMAATAEHCIDEIRSCQQEARTTCLPARFHWPVIVFTDTKGLDSSGGGRWPQAGGLLASTPGPNGEREEKSRPAAPVSLENWMRSFPDLKVRFINVVDLFKLQPHTEHPHGLSDQDFDSLFTEDKPIIFNFHGYLWLINPNT